MDGRVHPPMPGGAIDAPALDFRVEGVAVAQAAAPSLALELRIERTGGGPVRSITLGVQVRIAAPRRSYDAETKERLFTLFGPPADWARSLNSILWTRPTLMVPAFEDTTVVEVLLPCTYDIEVAHARYLEAVREGIIPLEVLLSGTVFYAAADGRLQVAQIPWDREAHHDLPATLWREAMDRYFPGARWLRLDGEAFDRLAAFRARQALPSWDAALGALLEHEDRA